MHAGSVHYRSHCYIDRPNLSAAAAIQKYSTKIAAEATVNCRRRNSAISDTPSTLTVTAKQAFRRSPGQTDLVCMYWNPSRYGLNPPQTSREDGAGQP